jgi:DNA-binding response OmpR family regulator
MNQQRSDIAADINAVDAARGSIAVLLVDDQRFVGMAVERLLAGEPDIKLHCCLAAKEAVARALDVAPAVIFQDLEMPDVDGLTLVGRYRSERTISATPIVVLSGNDDAASRERALAAGADDYLVKLPDKRTLVACIRRYAQRESANTSNDATLDRAVVAALREAVSDDTSNLVTALIDQFLDESAVLVHRLAEAAPQRDAAALTAAAHSLKGAAMTMGAHRLGSLSSQIEDLVKGGDELAGDRVIAIVAEMRQEMERVRAACFQEQQGLPRS